jgi:hypothetical protein
LVVAFGLFHIFGRTLLAVFNILEVGFGGLELSGRFLAGELGDVGGLFGIDIGLFARGCECGV